MQQDWPTVMLPEEAAAYLRLTEGREDSPKPAVRGAVNRLVDVHGLRPVLLGGKWRYLWTELDRWLEEQLE